MGKAKVGPKFRYDWRAIQRPGRRTFRRGVDFDCNCASFVTQLHGRAARSGMTVRTSVSGDEVSFEFIRPKRKGAKA